MILTINIIEIIILTQLVRYDKISTLAVILISVGLVIIEELIIHYCSNEDLFCVIQDSIFLTRLLFYGFLIAVIICSVLISNPNVCFYFALN